MAVAGELNRRVTFRSPTTDVNGENSGFTDAVTRDARVQSLKGGEAVQASRLAGLQPVILSVRRDATTKTITNGWQAIDARDATVKWDVTSVIVTEDLAWVEVQAVQRRGGDV